MTGRRRPASARWLQGIVLLAAACAAQAGNDDQGPTYTRDIAPILFQNCAACHRPGQLAPFPLLTYPDVRAHARQIAEVTTTRYMPPWLPASDVADYQGKRGLTNEQIDTIARWVEGGTPEGDPADLPPPPVWSEGWQLGEPDLVIEFPEPFQLQAEGVDVFRNFVLPVPVKGRHYVKAFEFRPGNPRVVHHAVMGIDRTNASRVLDAADPELGFGGMTMGNAEFPDGCFLAWTPGHLPSPGEEDISWRLEEGTDFIVQLHLHPSGKPEEVRPSIGFYFTDQPPTQLVTGIFLQSSDIDIPPGVSDYVVEDSFKIPVDLDVFSIYPHAHYLGKDIQAYATLPDGSTLWLLHIKDWDFNWQDQYQFVEPLRLPAGSAVTMRWEYDNSTDNVRNPNYPPLRVVAGNQTTDEMANLLLGVMPRNEQDLAILRESMLRRDLELDPDNWVAHFNLGVALQAQGRVEEALGHLRRATQLSPANARAYASLGNALQLTGRHEAAIASYREAVRLDPQHAEALYNLGVAYQALDQPERAVEAYRRALKITPDDPMVHINLGNVLAGMGSFEAALEQYSAALRVAPDSALAHANLGNALAQMGRLEEAVEQLREAQRLAPESTDVRYNLEAVLRMKDELDRAYAMARRSLALMRQAEDYYADGQLDQAIRTAEEALRLANQAQAEELIQPIDERLEVYKRARGGESLDR